MDMFADLLENTKGFPPEQRRDIENTADLLVIIGALARSDLAESAQYTLDHLPEMRMRRAQALYPVGNRESTLQLSGPDATATQPTGSNKFTPLHFINPEKTKDADGLTILNPDQASRLAQSARKLAVPGVDEQLKRRAALVELSLRLKAKLREVAEMQPELDPERLKQFEMALSITEKSMPAEMSSRTERAMMARMFFVQELRDAGGNVDLAVENFYKNVFEDKERGHWSECAFEKTVQNDKGGESTVKLENTEPDLQTQDHMRTMINREDAAERAEKVKANKVLQNMPKLAAEYLNPKEYAVYRMMIDNEHLLGWRVDEKGKMHFQAQTLDASDPDNTIGKIVQHELNYENIRGANRLVKDTAEKLVDLIRERGNSDITLSEKGKSRLEKSTAEIVADPASQARVPVSAGKQGKSKGKDSRKGVEL